MIIKCRLP